MRKQLHIISTGKQSKRELVEKALHIQPHVDFLHLREKGWLAKDYVEVIRTLDEDGFPKDKIIVNDRVDVAQVTGVRGVQLAYHSINTTDVRTHFPELSISCSVHSAVEAKQQEKVGAHGVLFGHVFATASKQGVPPRGLAQLEETVRKVDIPVIAIGGITPANIHSVLQTGAAGIAVLSGILLAEDVIDAAKKYREKLDAWKGG